MLDVAVQFVEHDADMAASTLYVDDNDIRNLGYGRNERRMSVRLSGHKVLGLLSTRANRTHRALRKGAKVVSHDRDLMVVVLGYGSHVLDTFTAAQQVELNLLAKSRRAASGEPNPEWNGKARLASWQKLNTAMERIWTENTEHVVEDQTPEDLRENISYIWYTI